MRLSVDAHRYGELTRTVAKISLSVGRIDGNRIISIPFKARFKGIVTSNGHQIKPFRWFEGPNQYCFADAFRASHYVDAIVVIVNLIHI